MMVLLETATWAEYSSLQRKMIRDVVLDAFGKVTVNGEHPVAMSADRRYVLSIRVASWWVASASPAQIIDEVIWCAEQIRKDRPRFDPERDYSRFSDKDLEFHLKRHREQLPFRSIRDNRPTTELTHHSRDRFHTSTDYPQMLWSVLPMHQGFDTGAQAVHRARRRRIIRLPSRHQAPQRDRPITRYPVVATAGLRGRNHSRSNRPERAFEVKASQAAGVKDNAGPPRSLESRTPTTSPATNATSTHSRLPPL